MQTPTYMQAPGVLPTLLTPTQHWKYFILATIKPLEERSFLQMPRVMPADCTCKALALLILFWAKTQVTYSICFACKKKEKSVIICFNLNFFFFAIFLTGLHNFAFFIVYFSLTILHTFSFFLYLRMWFYTFAFFV